jgi:hypothetical protein
MNDHCSWCGDPPDQFGSHGICSKHAVEVLQQHRERRAAARRMQQRDEQRQQAQLRERRYAG